MSASNASLATRSHVRNNSEEDDGYITERTCTRRSRLSRSMNIRSASSNLRRTDSQGSSRSDSSFSESEALLSQSPVSGRGRKVAATLQLFKETTDEQPVSSVSQTRREDVAEAQFEFVKRSEWPDREAEARRQRSKSSLQVRDQLSAQVLAAPEIVPLDLVQWRKDVGSTRGRRRERVSDVVFNLPTSTSFHDSWSPSFERPHSPPQTLATSHNPFIPIPRSRTRSPVFPVRAASPIDSSFSPFSTDDESTWESASITTSTSTTSLNSTLPHPESYDDSEEFLQPAFQNTSTQQNTLPHIPLKPFRNQVGGHSAIYKFTKRAVCKPLVSRENLFYESVEREAPPLLDFIPRYLGVMLVTYRRVPKSTTSPAPARPAFSKSATETPKFSPRTLTRRHNDEPLTTESDEAEMPEVVLDRNRHIVPEWMLHGKHRSMSSASIYPVPQSRVMIPNSTPGPSTLARYSSCVSSAPTPVNSPAHFTNPFPAKLTNQPRFADNDTGFHRSGLPSQYSENILRSPGMFGGTGSTVVNAKLKDRVFSNVLRRLHRFRRKEGTRRTAGVRTEDEGDVADGESDDAQSCRTRRVRKAALVVSPTTPLRRIHSDSTLSPSRTSDAQKGNILDVYEMDSPEAELDLSPSFRRRSRSRSLDYPRVSPGHPLHEHSSIPEDREHDPSVTRQNHFILMEDLTGRLKRSCVIDLKMGTRQYGIDATSIKKKSQRKKSDRTTSGSLGVRVCGMQVWNNLTQSYVTQDKYVGRNVRPDEFEAVLSSFLHDGQRLLAHQIPDLLQRLYALARIISRLKGYRFYGCSLLLIYDGDHECQDSFKSSVLEHPSSRSRRGESLERQATSESHPNLRRTHSEELLLGSVAQRSDVRRKRGQVGVRIVDFAHTTTGKDWLPSQSTDKTGTSDGYQPEIDPETGLLFARFPPHYPETPDRGFLFGLKTLCTTLELIWNGERIKRLKASRDDLHLPALPTDGKEIFDEIFGADGEDTGMIST